MKIKKILIFGATGFVGSSLKKKFLKTKKFKVIAPSKKKLNMLHSKKMYSFLSKNKFDFVLNCAADVGSVHYVKEYKADILHNNLLMNLNLYKCVKETSPDTVILNIYSNCCYKGSSNHQYENKFLAGQVHESVFSYGNFKRTLYFISKAYLDQYKVKSINLMFPSIYGPGDSLDPYKTHAMNGIIIRALKNKFNKKKTFEVWGSGKPLRNWLYIDDAVNSIILFINKKLTNQMPINIVNEKAISIKKIVEIVINKIDKKMKIYNNKKYSDGSKARFLKPGTFKKLFPKFKFTNYQSGILKTIYYYENEIKKKENYK